jgi:hypothetical protein
MFVIYSEAKRQFDNSGLIFCELITVDLCELINASVYFLYGKYEIFV